MKDKCKHLITTIYPIGVSGDDFKLEDTYREICNECGEEIKKSTGN